MNDVAAVFSLLQDDVVEGALDIVLFDPLKRPVSGLFEGLDGGRGVMRGIGRASEGVRGLSPPLYFNMSKYSLQMAICPAVLCI